mgnify:CR=1 FL=1
MKRQEVLADGGQYGHKEEKEKGQKSTKSRATSEGKRKQRTGPNRTKAKQS